MNKKLLLHICCAPDLISEGWEVTGFFYGSNIYPLNEYNLRLKALEKLIACTKINCEIMKYNPEERLEKSNMNQKSADAVKNVS